MFKNIVSLFILILTVSFSHGQNETGIPYQGILRDNSGSELSNATATIQAIIRINSANGSIIFSESHDVTTDDFGYFQLVIGTGNVNNSFPNFNQIDWSTNLKFLQIQVNFGSGFVDLGTSQLLSVPYALFADDCDCNMSISPIGDTLFTGGGGYLIVPGISNANPEFGGLGLIVLPGNDICGAQQISVTTCGGDSTLTYNGYTYNLVEINNQCWFEENLRTEFLNDGTPIPNITDNLEWNNATTPAYCKFSNVDIYGSTYGYLYNFYANINENLCPVGWHVPTDCEFMFLENSIGMSLAQQQGGNQPIFGLPIQVQTIFHSPLYQEGIVCILPMLHNQVPSILDCAMHFSGRRLLQQLRLPIFVDYFTLTIPF
jgi:Fibrobacter succinogenes major domain (Fib_succ_major)